MSNSERVCVVVDRKISLDYIKMVRLKQENRHNPNTRVGDEDAFTKTLRGSKIFLKEFSKKENMKA